MDYLKRFDDIDKVLIYKKEWYVPIIYKNDELFAHNSVWVMYAKRNRDSISQKVLFAVQAGSIELALAKFISIYDELCAGRIIQEGRWYGNVPVVLDYNIKCNVGVTNVT